jgi:hypothetical protein
MQFFSLSSEACIYLVVQWNYSILSPGFSHLWVSVGTAKYLSLLLCLSQSCSSLKTWFWPLSVIPSQVFFMYSNPFDFVS